MPPSPYRIGGSPSQANFVEGSHTFKNKIAYFDQIERFFAITSYKFSRFKFFFLILFYRLSTSFTTSNKKIRIKTSLHLFLFYQLLLFITLYVNRINFLFSIDRKISFFDSKFQRIFKKQLNCLIFIIFRRNIV